MTHDDVMRAVQERDVKFIRLWFTDVLGRLKSFALPVEQLPQALAHGVRFDGSSITGFNPVEESDMVAVPDPATFAILPVPAAGAGRRPPDLRRPYPCRRRLRGRSALRPRRAMDRARDMGFDGFEVATELEFFYFRDSTTPEPLDQGGYFDLTTLDVASDVRRATVLALEQIGIDVEFSHHESGPSQHEIDMRQTDALQMADNVMTYRTIVKEIAHQHGWYATFMPKPLMDANGSGMHTHVALIAGGQNAFFDPDEPSQLSAVGRGFVAGILRHARELCFVFAQWVNSYKRLVPGFEAPVYVAWSERNRSAVVRVPQQGAVPDNTAGRPELRGPDPACNPYLTFAAILHAGLEGIARGYELPDAMEMNLYHLSHAERLRAGVEQLPSTLGRRR